MKFIETPFEGVFELDAAPHIDNRGAFARLYCQEVSEQAGIRFSVQQINLSMNPCKHTLRGMHYQDPPYAEAKFVRAARGRAYDVALDLRRDSPTFRKWHAVELSGEQMNGLYLPEGIAHGFLTLEPNTDILYLMGRKFEPGHGRGVRYDDPSFAIDWPTRPTVISDRDLSYPNWSNESMT